MTEEYIMKCAIRIVNLTGYGQELHVNDIIPDLEELARKTRTQALQEKDTEWRERIEGMKQTVRTLESNPNEWYEGMTQEDKAWNSALSALLQPKPKDL